MKRAAWQTLFEVEGVGMLEQKVGKRYTDFCWGVEFPTSHSAKWQAAEAAVDCLFADCPEGADAHSGEMIQEQARDGGGERWPHDLAQQAVDLLLAALKGVKARR